MISIGVLTPYGSPGPEEELPTMASGRVSVRLVRFSAEAAGGAGTAPTSPSGLRELAK